jgi:hypothetical protein
MKKNDKSRAGPLPKKHFSIGTVILWNYTYLFALVLVFFFLIHYTAQVTFENLLWMLGLQALANLLMAFLPGSSPKGHILSIWLMPFTMIVIWIGLFSFGII